jgi:hypothetical protein
MSGVLHGTGPISKEGDRDEEGFREYKVVWLVKAAYLDGPYVVLQTPGLPSVGSYYSIGNDSDPWAWCRAGTKIKSHQAKAGEDTRYWTVEQTFSNKPPGSKDKDKERCQDVQIEDPLLEPPKVSGNFVNRSEEAVTASVVKVKKGDGTITRTDTNLPIRNSAGELLRGPQVEFEKGYPTVSIEQNVSNLQLALCSSLINGVNDAPLWGLSTRMIKLSQFSWSRHYQGICSVYYTRKFEFEVNDKTFDRDALDEGTKCRQGHWDAAGAYVVDNANKFVRALDAHDNPIRVVLNGDGRPLDVDITDPGKVHIEKYPEVNFLSLGIPTTL